MELTQVEPTWSGAHQMELTQVEPTWSGANPSRCWLSKAYPKSFIAKVTELQDDVARLNKLDRLSIFFRHSPWSGKACHFFFLHEEDDDDNGDDYDDDGHDDADDDADVVRLRVCDRVYKTFFRQNLRK
jgi:hypothetical protein